MRLAWPRPAAVRHLRPWSATRRPPVASMPPMKLLAAFAEPARLSQPPLAAAGSVQPPVACWRLATESAALMTVSRATASQRPCPGSARAPGPGIRSWPRTCRRAGRGRLRGRDEIGRHRADPFGMRAIAGRDVIPKPVAADRQDQRRQHHRAPGNAALHQRHRERKIARHFETGDFVFKTTDRLIAIEAEMHGIGAHEALRIDWPRQPVVPVFLDRGQVSGADTQRRTNAIDFAAIALARLTQQFADRVTRVRTGLFAPWNCRQATFAISFGRSAEQRHRSQAIPERHFAAQRRFVVI